MFLIVSIKLCYTKYKNSPCVVAKSWPSLMWPHGLQPARLLLSMEFSGQKYWSRLLFPSPGDHPYLGIEPASPALTGIFSTTDPSGKPVPKNSLTERINLWGIKIYKSSLKCADLAQVISRYKADVLHVTVLYSSGVLPWFFSSNIFVQLLSILKHTSKST